ncbi:MAG: S8 family serine peptidase [Helicobacteraceae bacterium]|jgi:kexin|nr:S8 family serine peptidase [Helicobacteraceae bacterium]
MRLVCKTAITPSSGGGALSLAKGSKVMKTLICYAAIFAAFGLFAGCGGEGSDKDDEYDEDACLLTNSTARITFTDNSDFNVNSLIAIKTDIEQTTLNELILGPLSFAPQATCPTSTDTAVFNLNGKTSNITGNDPLAKFQWHLDNIGQKSGVFTPALKAGEDLNVLLAWRQGFKGNGVTIGIVDNGTDFTHPDLAPTKSALSWNYKTNKNDPYPVATTAECAHGTMTAGIAGARGSNGAGVMGVAPSAKLAGLNIGLDCGFSASNTQTAGAMGKGVDVSSNSWGSTLAISVNELLDNAIIEGATTGRNNKGRIYVFAAGNHREHNGNGNYDSMQSLFQSISVAALRSDGKYTYYSNKGANLLVSAYGGEPSSNPGILTTDIKGCDKGYSAKHETKHEKNNNGEYTAFMNGTSAATPMVSGVAALMLEANPNLTWRDVRYILATTARKNDSSNNDWKNNGAGWHINHNYGFGAVNACAAVKKAKTFTSLGALKTKEEPQNINSSVNFLSPTERTINVSGSGIDKIEHVDVWVDIDDSAAALKLNITLTSPDGTVSELAYNDYSGSGSSAWQKNIFNGGFRFGTARHLDEEADGNWKLTIGGANQTRTFREWRIKIHGRSN